MSFISDGGSGWLGGLQNIFSPVLQNLRMNVINYKSKSWNWRKDGFEFPPYYHHLQDRIRKKFRVRIDIAGVPRGEGCGSNKKIAQQNAAQIATLNYSKEEILSRVKGEVKDELLSD